MKDFAEQARHYHKIIREILLKEWDPIGISHIPEAQDEYNGYVGEVYRLFSRRASQREFFDYLWSLETQHMGLCGNRQRTEKIAERLAGLVQEASPENAAE